MCIAAIRRRTELDRVTGKEHLFLREPNDRIPCSMAAPDVNDLNFATAKPERHALVEDKMGPSEPGDALLASEQPRKTPDLAVHILLAALNNEVARHIGGNDLGIRIRRSAKHTHRVIMAQHHVMHR